MTRTRSTAPTSGRTATRSRMCGGARNVPCRTAAAALHQRRIGSSRLAVCLPSALLCALLLHPRTVPVPAGLPLLPPSPPHPTRCQPAPPACACASSYGLIPHVEKLFRGVGAGWARALHGGSTGGWESIGVQVTALVVAGRCWSLLRATATRHEAPPAPAAQALAAQLHSTQHWALGTRCLAAGCAL
jgi:hypothetical protein